MKNKASLIILLSLITMGVYARPSSDISLSSSYIIPVENSAFNSSLVLGVNAGFWGIFEFTANTYLEIDYSEKDFFDKFQSPNVVSAGIGVNIPLGGFYFKSDYQRFFAMNSETNELSISRYSDSYKLGIGIMLDRDVEIEVYHRTLFDIENIDLNGNTQGFIGIGLNITL